MNTRTLTRAALWLALVSISFAARAADPAGARERSKPVARPVFVHNPEPDVNDAVNYCIDSAGNTVDCSTLIPLEYYGHRIVSNPVVWVIFWTDKVDATTQASIGAFYAAVTNSELFDWLIEYSTIFDGSSGTNQALGRGVYGGAYTINPTSNTTTSIADGDIEQELKNQFNAGGLPQPDNNSIYMVYFPPGYTIDGGGSTGNSCSSFCAYHSVFDFGGTLDIGGQDVFYGVFPDLGSGGCNGGCGGNTVFENLCSVSTHELVETTTDGEISLPFVLDPGSYFVGFAWDSFLVPVIGSGDPGNEVGDMCNGSESTSFTDTITSIVDGKDYTIQKIFSANTDQCQTYYGFVNDYRFWVNPAVLIIAPGTTGVVPVYSQTTYGSPSSHTLSMSGSLTNVAASLDKTAFNPDDSTYARFTAGDGATINSEAVYTLTSTDTASPAIQPYAPRTAAVMVRIEPAPASISLTGVSNNQTVIGTLSLKGTASPYSSRYMFFLGLYIDGQYVDTTGNTTPNTAASLTYSWDTSGYAQGSSHQVILYAEDSDGGNSQIDYTVIIGGPAKVQVTSPANNATVSGTQALTASGTPKTGSTLAHMTISVDGTIAGTGNASPYSYSWNTSQVSNGTHTITAGISDSDGSTGTSTPVTVTVHNLPTIAFATPSTANVNGMVPISVTAAAVHGATIGSITLDIDGTQVATGTASPLAFTWDATTLSNGGSHTLLATITDGDGTSATATKTVAVLDGPLVNVTRPTNATTVNGVIAISASATPALGTTVSSISISVDGTEIATMNAPSITESWDTTKIANGTHTVSAQATDADTGSSTSTVTVTVSNAAVVNGFTISLDPATAVLPIGGTVVFNVRTTLTGAAEAITLSVAGLPDGVTGAFNAPTVMAGENATLTLTAASTAAPSDSTVFSVGGVSASVPGGHSTTASVTVEAGASSGCSNFGGVGLALLGLLPLLRRRRVLAAR